MHTMHIASCPGAAFANFETQSCITLLSDNFDITFVTAATLSFRAPAEFAEQTKALAKSLSMTSSDYVREAVREKNERALRQRMVFLSATLSARHLAENLSLDGSTGDGLG